LRTSQGYIFFILQHLATNLCGFTHSKALFLAVVLDFVLLALIKIQSIAGITHCYGCSSNSPAFTRSNQQLVIGKLRYLTDSDFSKLS
jgi:hypothetical protein